MDKFETSPPVRDVSERWCLNQHRDRIVLVLMIIVGVILIAGIGWIIYYFVTREPATTDFDVSDANDMVDAIFRHNLDDEIPVCDHSIILPMFNHSSRFYQNKACIETLAERFPIPDVDFPYYERNFSCEVSGVNVSTENNFSLEPCRYDGDFKIFLGVSNRTSGSTKGGNPFKVIRLQISFEEKSDYSKRLGKMVKGFSWVTGEKIAHHAKDKFIKKYGHEDYAKDVAFDEFQDPDICLHFWPCPTTVV